MSMDSDIQNNARRAIDPYLASVTYPIIWSDGAGISTLGSSVLFQHGEQHFLLTARHLFDAFDRKTHTRFPYEGLVGPVGMQKVPPRELGKIYVHGTEGAEAAFLDVVAIELLEDSFVQEIKKLWSFISVHNFASPNLESTYFVAGFSKVRERLIGENIGASFMSLVTQEAEDVPHAVEEHDPRYDLVLKYDSEAFDFYRGNKTIESPSVGGVSGGPIFRVADKVSGGVWAPKTSLNFVGLQCSSIATNKWLRVKNVHAIAKYFDTAIPEIGAAIMKQLGS
jgi:hypothetical protein